MASEAERYLRGLAVERLRQLMPGARIVHELNVETGACRVDLAAVAPAHLVFVEIKSRKDTLDRLPEQARTFRPACHSMAVCYASERWNYDTVSRAAGYSCNLWPEDRRNFWSLRAGFKPPNTSAMLNLLWRDELHAEASRHNLQPSSRASRQPLMAMMWGQLTGREVVEAVCRQLRARKFAEADAPIFADVAEAA